MNVVKPVILSGSEGSLVRSKQRVQDHNVIAARSPMQGRLGMGPANGASTSAPAATRVVTTAAPFGDVPRPIRGDVEQRTAAINARRGQRWAGEQQPLEVRHDPTLNRSDTATASGSSARSCISILPQLPLLQRVPQHATVRFMSEIPCTSERYASRCYPVGTAQCPGGQGTRATTDRGEDVGRDPESPTGR
jgi:hypothetical protein